MWESIVASAVAGVVAALAFAFVVHCWRRCQGCKEAAAICKIIVRRRPSVLSAQEVSPPPGLPLPRQSRDEWRARSYNRMIVELRTTLDHWSPHLPLERRQSLMLALDWFHAEVWYNIADDDGQNSRYLRDDETQPGLWPLPWMPLGTAENRFQKLERLTWLKLPKAESSD